MLTPMVRESAKGYSRQSVAFVRVASRGSSMWPTLRHGDTLLVDNMAPPAVGDIVVLRAGEGSFIAHRLVAMANGLVRCTNARGEPDPWVSRDHVFGRVACVERDGRLLAVGREPPNVRILWALRSSYGLARRIAHRVRRSLRDRQA